MSHPGYNEQDPYVQQSVPPPSGPYPQPYGQLQPYQQHPPYGQPGYGHPGYGPPPYGQPYYRNPQQETGLAVASLVCSLIGIVFCVVAIAGIVFGHVAYSKAKRGEAGGQGMAQAGMIIGYIITGLWLIPFALWFIFGIALLGSAGIR